MKSLIALTIIFTLLNNSAYAKIGASESYCNRKYGKPVTEGAKEKKREFKNTYKFNDCYIGIVFKNSGSAVELSYIDIKIEDIEGILKANSSGMKWEKSSENRWDRNKGAITAELKTNSSSKYYLVIRDENYYKKKEKTTAKTDKKSW